MSGASSEAARKPGRKAETPAQRVARLERDLKAARDADKAAQQFRYAIIGEAVDGEAKGDPNFDAKMRDILRRRVTSKAGRAAIAPLLAK